VQFVRNGPDIPERLLQAHEDGRVVFFCGAGISYPAGLPGFDGLVKRLYEDLQPLPNAVQRAAIKAKHYDTAVGLLEVDIVGGREKVRKALADILTPKVSVSRNAIATHESLLTLARSREGQTRLVTTNFDRLFEEVVSHKALEIQGFQAPLLPVPKSRWDGLVYLHGLLNFEPTTNDLDRLVISSGDFGLAYLIERWAARFVSELFRNYTVCFVGYSLDDPVLRYMMDALAADRLLGESPPEMFAFGSFSKGKEADRANEWRAKNVTPILYRQHNRHAYLHKTLRAWAETYRDGVGGKERIVVECAMARPLASTKQDDFVGRLLWALSDPRGLPAKRFAELNPVPSLDWLEPLSDPRYRHEDLPRFGIPPNHGVDEGLSFSLTQRPSPYSLAPFMTIVDGGSRSSRWDEVMHQIARWMIRHLDDPALLLWLVRRGGQLHENLVLKIENRLDELVRLELDKSNVSEIKRIRESSPRAVPGPLMRTLWRLLLTGRVKSRMHEFDLYRWGDRFQRDGLTATLRLELRQMLMPCVLLREPFRWPSDEDGGEPESLRELVEWEIALVSNYTHTILSELDKNPCWRRALPELLADFSGLLRDVLDLKRELGGADARSDLSYIQRPSISEHEQNSDMHDWTAIINLCRDSWLAKAEQSHESARLAAERWWEADYPLFRRLAFFAATQDGIIPNWRALDWLLADERWWLWSEETEREAMRLMVTLAPQLSNEELRQLEDAILAGPPPTMFRDNIAPERWREIVDRDTWLRLAKTAATGVTLTSKGNDRLAELTARHPGWHLAPDERDEFPYWMGDGDELRKFMVTPRHRRDLVQWLKKHPTKSPWQEDDWQKRCRDNFATVACALYELSKQGVWPLGRWREALQAWSEETLVNRSWHYIGPILTTVPEEEMLELSRSVSWWLKSIAKNFVDHEPRFFMLINRILNLEHRDGVDTEEPVMRAINHPIGHVTDALLVWWYRRTLEDGQGLAPELRTIFALLCDTAVEKFRHGRVLLARHVIVLFRVDKDWSLQYFLPLFDWQRSEAEARAVWVGFLGSPRLYRPLLEVLKPHFLETADHYDALGEYGNQYASLLTFAALDPADTFATNELAKATRSLPLKGLEESSQALVNALDGAGEQRADYWANRIKPYLRKIWPNTRENISPSIAERFGRLCIAADEAFPEALEMLRAWLQPPPHPDFLIRRFYQANLSERFPEPALEFLSRLIGDQSQWIPGDLRRCLAAICLAAPELENDARYQRLILYIRQRGRG
jgi:SIR2-like protein